MCYHGNELDFYQMCGLINLTEVLFTDCLNYSVRFHLLLIHQQWLMLSDTGGN